MNRERRHRIYQMVDELVRIRAEEQRARDRASQLAIQRACDEAIEIISRAIDSLSQVQ